MRSKLGTACMALGTALVLAALSLFLWNRQESIEAEAFAEKVLPQIIEQIKKPDTTDVPADEPNLPNPYDTAMTEVEIDGYAYVGYLSIPAAGLELPVMSDWSREQLRIAPCRYFGSTKTDDLVLCAHNYARYFGPIRKLVPGDAVYFIDMDGLVWQYEVETMDVLTPADVEEMTAGDYALTLFTCTYDRRNRVAVRCRRVGEE